MADRTSTLIQALWDCMKAAGADTSYADGAQHAYALGESGQPTMPVAAVQAVEELRKDYDECPAPEDLKAAEARVAELEAALRRIVEPNGMWADDWVHYALDIARTALEPKGQSLD